MLKLGLHCLVIWVVVLLTAIHCLAQSSERLGWGIESGINIGLFDYVNPAPNWNVKPAVGYYLRGTRDIDINDVFAVTPSLSYVRLRSDVDLDADATSAGGGFSIYQDYVGFGLILKASTHKGVRFQALVGPQLGVLLRAEREVTEAITTGGGDVQIQRKSIDMYQSMRETDFSIILGVGIEFETVSGPLVRLDAQYNHGLVESTESQAEVRWKRRDLSIGVGVLF